MKFRTEIENDNRFQGLITHDRPIVMVGSCFSYNIGGCLRQRLFDVTVNPLGTLYNPLSIASSIEHIVDSRKFDDSDMFHDGQLWHSFHCHSMFSSHDKYDVIQRMNESVSTANISLANASVLILTLGTTRVFNLKETGETVANCHKQPSSLFNERYITLDETTSTLKKIIQRVRKLNNEIKIIFTVSPVRHPGNSLHADRLSKSTLMLGIENVIDESDGILYFPAYEIMVDDLRDYRFYADDMRHPSTVAIQYIYSRFEDMYFSDETRISASTCEKFTRRLSHRFMTDNTLAMERFNCETEKLENQLISTYPYIVYALYKFKQKQ